MHVSIIKITLRLPGNRSLKQKRKVLHSLLSRIKQKFNVTIAEVEHQNKWQLTTLGFASVSGDKQQAERITDFVLDFIEKDAHGDFQLIEQTHEIISGV